MIRYRHVNRPFTQGFILLDDDIIVETSGGYGESYIQIYNYKTGEVKKKVDLKPEHFAEGIAEYENEFHVLTWREKVVLVYDKDLNYVREYPSLSDGWGMINYVDDSFLITNGSAIGIEFYPNKGDRHVNERPFTCLGQQIAYVNELEVVGNQILANVFGQELLVYFNYDTLECEKIVSCPGLYRLNSEGIVQVRDFFSCECGVLMKIIFRVAGT